MRIILDLVLITLATMLAASEAKAEDVYNFYFQKGTPFNETKKADENPVKDPASKSAEPLAQPTPAPASAVVPAGQTEVAKLQKQLFNGGGSLIPKNFGMGLGKTSMTDARGDRPGYSLGFDYRFSRNWFMDAQLIFASDFTRDSGRSIANNMESFDGSLGAGYNLFHLDLNSFDIEVAALAGIMTVLEGQTVYVFIDHPDNGAEDRSVRPYLGFSVAANFSPSFQVIAQFKRYDVNEVEYDYSYWNPVKSIKTNLQVATNSALRWRM
jgi:hypothetical protein